MTWRTRTLGEICDEGNGVIRTGPFGSQLHESDYSEEGTPVVMPKDIIEGKVSENTIARVSDAHLERLAQHRLLTGDIVYGRRGDIGRQALITRKESGWLCGTGCLRISLGSSPLDAKFLHYFLRDARVIDGIAKQAVGATMPNLNTSILRSVLITYPDETTQRRISSMLSSYDNLIENNTRRIQILDEMARRIYEEWFVRFRFPGHENVEMIESEIGLIPVGWKAPYSEHIDYLEGPGLRNWQYREQGVPFLNIRTLVPHDIDKSKLQFLSHQEVEQKYKHFLLKAYDHVVSSSGTLGRIVTVQERHLPLMLNTSIIRMRPKSERMGKWLLKHFLSSPYFQNQINAFAIGSAQKNYGPSHLKQMWTIAPTREVVIEFERLVSPLEEQMLNLSKRNATLRAARDLLLPKLISGEIDVSNFPEPVSD